MDHIATFRKLHLFTGEDRVIVLQSAGNLATTQSVISLLTRGAGAPCPPSLYEAAALIGQTIRTVISRDGGQQQGHINFGCNIPAGGRSGERHRLFHIYPEGNFIEASADTPYFQIGESKYGKPILDRIIHHETPLQTALQCALISHRLDPAQQSVGGLAPGRPGLCTRAASRRRHQHRITEQNPHFVALRKASGRGLQQLFQGLPTFPLSWAGAPRRFPAPFFPDILAAFLFDGVSHAPLQRHAQRQPVDDVPFYVCILICVALLMVKFAMQLYCCAATSRHPLPGSHHGVLPTLVDFVLVAQMLILVAICGYVQFIKTPEQRAALGDNWLSKINFASLKLIVIHSLVTIAGIEDCSKPSMTTAPATGSR